VATGLQKLFQDNMDQIASTSSDYLQGAGGVAVNIVSSVFSALTQIGFVLTLSVLFSVEKDNTMKLIRRIDKKNKSNRHNKITKIYEKLGFWLRSQLLLCLFIFCMTGVGLLILSWFGLDIPNILSLALIA
jgi:predicted PurR-regulated permease PerM